MQKQQTVQKLQQILKRQQSAQSVHLFVFIVMFFSVFCSSLWLMLNWQKADTTFWPIFYVISTLSLFIFGRGAMKASRQMKLCRDTIKSLDEDPEQDTFARVYQTTTMADAHEQALFRQNTILFLPKVAASLLFIAVGVGVTIYGAAPGGSAYGVLFGFIWAVLWVIALYNVVTGYFKQHKVAKETKQAAEILREKRQATIGAMSVTVDSTQSGAMSLAHEHEGGLTDVERRSDVVFDDAVVLAFDEQDESQASVVVGSVDPVKES